MGTVGDCYDNAMCESFFATLECELLDRRHLTVVPRHGWRCLSSSKVGTTPIVVTDQLSMSRR